jgi:hypothetical protein
MIIIQIILKYTIADLGREQKIFLVGSYLCYAVNAEGLYNYF